MSREIVLTRGKVALVDDADYEELVKYKWCVSHGYAVRRRTGAAKGKQSLTPMHDQIMNPPPGYEVDHIHGNTLDNRRSELRIATHAENCLNKGRLRNNTSGHTGVSLRRDTHKWVAYIEIGGTRTRLGCYADIKDAIRARVDAEKEYFGKFSRNGAA